MPALGHSQWKELRRPSAQQFEVLEGRSQYQFVVQFLREYNGTDATLSIVESESQN